MEFTGDNRIYKGQNTPHNQQILVELLREVQKQHGGVIPITALAEIADGLKMKETYLRAIIKRYPSLRTEEAPHLLEICGGERCGKKIAGRCTVTWKKTIR